MKGRYSWTFVRYMYTGIHVIKGMCTQESNRKHCCIVFSHYIRRRKSIKEKGFLALLGTVGLFYLVLYLLWPNNNVTLPDGVDADTLPPFEPEVVYDFPEGDPHAAKIPKIVHWTFKGTSIPPGYHVNIKSFVENNPRWTFYLWTDYTSRQFIRDTHPELLATFDGYSEYVRRADFIRYVVLYEMGGIYVDLDVINFRPLDRLVSKYSCIFPTEPFEHAVLRAHIPYLINNAIMLSKPKHPFLGRILLELPRFAHMFTINDATGPVFVTAVFMMYNNLGREEETYDGKIRSSNSPYFYKGELPEDHDDAVYIPNSQYFCNNVDPKARIFLYRACKDFENLNRLEKRACANMASRGMIRKNKYTFLEHQFSRMYAYWNWYVYSDIYLWMFSKDITELVPGVKIYTGRS